MTLPAIQIGSLEIEADATFDVSNFVLQSAFVRKSSREPALTTRSTRPTRAGPSSRAQGHASTAVPVASPTCQRPEAQRSRLPRQSRGGLPCWDRHGHGRHDVAPHCYPLVANPGLRRHHRRRHRRSRRGIQGHLLLPLPPQEDLLVDLGWATVDRVGTEAEEDYRLNGNLDRAIEVGIAGLVRRVTGMPPGAVARTIQEFGFRRAAAPERPCPDRARSAPGGTAS